MTIFLAITRLVLISILTIVMYLLYLLGLGLYLLINKNPRWFRNKMVTFWAGSMKRILGMKVDIKGTLPEPPFFLVSNHLSYIDVIPYFAHLSTVFVAKSELKSWPVLGTMAKSINIIFIEREKFTDIPRVNRLISDYLNNSQGVIVFPEATSTKGEKVKSFKSALLQYPATVGFPVSYSAITYQSGDPRFPAREYICWWGDMTFLDHFFNLLKIRKFRVTISFGEKGVHEKNRKKLADRLHQLVKEKFIPVDEHLDSAVV